MTDVRPEVEALARSMIDGKEQLDDILKELRDKIKGKFQVSTFLAGLCFPTLSAQIALLPLRQDVLLLPLSVSFLIVAEFLFIAAVISLDALTMPKIFWTTDRCHTPEEIATYGPDSMLPNFTPPWPKPKNLWTLKNLMVWFWSWLTLIALFLMAVSFLLALMPYHIETGGTRTIIETFWMMLPYVGCSVAGALVYIAIIYVSAAAIYGRLIWD